MTSLPLPLIVQLDGITLIDDSKNGTKTRIANALIRHYPRRDFFYATTPDGASPISLAQACQETGQKLTLISTRSYSQELSPALRKAKEMGAVIDMIKEDSLAIAEAEARYRAKASKAVYIDFDNDVSIKIVAEEAKKLNLNPGQVWSASARGAMARAYQIAWPLAEHYSIVIVPDVPGADFGNAKCISLKESWAKAVRNEPPFPCNSYYEARAWPGVVLLANRAKNPLFWNPAGPN